MMSQSLSIALLLFACASLRAAEPAATTIPTQTATAPTTAPASRPVAAVDDATWRRMHAIDAKASSVADLSADFEQQKFTPMLKKPLTSSGRVFVRGGTMLWDTKKPEPNMLRIDPREVRIYYPAQQTIEVYQVEQKLGQLAASPLPRLAVLREHFDFQPLALAELGETDHEKFLGLRMTPTQPDLREHVEEVRVLLDAARGLIVRLEMRDSDGDRTLISFAGVKTNTGLAEKDVEITAPPGVKVTRPLAAMEGASSSSSSTPSTAAPSLPPRQEPGVKQGETK